MEHASFPYRLVASDLDGTLLGPDKEIGKTNTAAVRRMQATGARFVLASGRRHQNSLRYYRELGLDGLMISCAGALVKDPDSGYTVREVLLSAALAAALVSAGKAGGYTVIYYHRDHLYVDVRNHWTELYESRVGEQAELLPGDLADLKGEAALKLVWYGGPDAMKTERERLKWKYGATLQIISTDAENLEFSAPAANKAKAVAAVAAYYGVPQAETLTFGDGENDASMLRWASWSVAMDGGNELAKAAAEMVGPSGPPDESFARAVEAVFARTEATMATHG